MRRDTTLYHRSPDFNLPPHLRRRDRRIKIRNQDAHLGLFAPLQASDLTLGRLVIRHGSTLGRQSGLVDRVVGLVADDADDEAAQGRGFDGGEAGAIHIPALDNPIELVLEHGNGFFGTQADVFVNEGGGERDGSVDLVVWSRKGGAGVGEDSCHAGEVVVGLLVADEEADAMGADHLRTHDLDVDTPFQACGGSCKKFLSLLVAERSSNCSTYCQECQIRYP